MAAAPGALSAGQLFTWGRGTDGQLGQDDVCFPGRRGKLQSCAIPTPVPGMASVAHVSCGTGQQGCTLACTADGRLFAFGNNYKGRLGLGHSEHVRKPTLVTTGMLASKHRVIMTACGFSHTLALCSDGEVLSWGSPNHGALGREVSEACPAGEPHRVALPGPAKLVDADNEGSAALLRSGELMVWGLNCYGRMGQGHKEDVLKPAPVMLPASVEGGGGARGREAGAAAAVGEETSASEAAGAASSGVADGDSAAASLAGAGGGAEVATVSMGSVYAAAVTADGRLFAWGLGRYGNLGCGGRPAAKTRPVRVAGGALRDKRVVGVSCTRGQEGFKGGVGLARAGGAEGPHTVAWTEAGELVTFGTCHKGLLCNLGSKEGAFRRPEWDELEPFLVGSAVRNGSRHAPLSPHAVWPPPYSAMGRVVTAVSAHIHGAALTADGALWAWGCGSNDGRCGVERFLAMNGEGRPPAVDSMKCYMMGPHRVGAVRRLYWPFNRGLEGMAVVQVASGRNHMACIAISADAKATS